MRCAESLTTRTLPRQTTVSKTACGEVTSPASEPRSVIDARRSRRRRRWARMLAAATLELLIHQWLEKPQSRRHTESSPEWSYTRRELLEVAVESLGEGDETAVWRSC